MDWRSRATREARQGTSRGRRDVSGSRWRSVAGQPRRDDRIVVGGAHVDRLSCHDGRGEGQCRHVPSDGARRRHPADRARCDAPGRLAGASGASGAGSMGAGGGTGAAGGIGATGPAGPADTTTLCVTNKASRRRVPRGGLVRWTIVVTNCGERTATGVFVSDRLRTGAKPKTRGSGALAGDQLVWKTGTLGPGAQDLQVRHAHRTEHEHGSVRQPRDGGRRQRPARERAGLGRRHLVVVQQRHEHRTGGLQPPVRSLRREVRSRHARAPALHRRR